MSTEFNLGGNRYVAEKIWPAKLQVHVVRRLGPAAATALAAAITTSVAGGSAKEAFTDGIAEKVGGATMGEMAQAVHKILVEISAMSDTNWDYISDACLSVVKRESGAALAPVMESRTKQMLFQDMDYQALLLCVYHVLKETYGAFFPGQPSTSSGPPAATASS